MSKISFLFDLDSTIMRQEILPAVLKKKNLYERVSLITERNMCGEIPFKQNYLQQVEFFKRIPVSEIRKIAGEIQLNEIIVDFIKKNKDRCYIVTDHLDVWIEELVDRLEIGNNIFCSKALVNDDYLEKVLSVVDKHMIVSQSAFPFVAIGSGNNDAEMIEAAEVGIGYGGVKNIAASVMNCADYVIYDEKKLVDFLTKLV